jgi:hypothetical protein
MVVVIVVVIVVIVLSPSALQLPSARGAASQAAQTPACAPCGRPTGSGSSTLSLLRTRSVRALRPGRWGEHSSSEESSARAGSISPRSFPALLPLT